MKNCFKSIFVVSFIALTLSILLYPAQIRAGGGGDKVLVRPEMPLLSDGGGDKVAAEKPVYILFDNLDRYYHGVQTNYSDTLYYSAIRIHPFFKNLSEMVPFSDATLNARTITDYDIAIFPMGDEALSYRTPGGIKVIDVINQMLDAGKSVFICGRRMLRNANQDGTVQNFISNTLGINNSTVKILPTKTSTTYIPFQIVAVEDSILSGSKKWGNQIRRREPTDPWFPPWGWADDVETFKKPTNNPFTCIMDWFTYEPEKYNVDNTIVGDTLVGIRTTVKRGNKWSKIAFWSIGFESGTGFESIPDWQMEMQMVMAWLMKELPMPEPYITFSTDPLYFGGVPIGTDSIRTFEVINFGRKPLIIDDCFPEDFYSDPDDFGTYQVIDFVPTTLPAHPNGRLTVKVKFSPKAEKRYQDYLGFESNSWNKSYATIDLDGWGGAPPDQGPKMTILDTVVDFGSVSPIKYKVLPIQIINPGTAPLQILTLEWQLNGNGSFSFDTEADSKTPKLVNPIDEDGKYDTCKINIKFVPLDEPGNTFEGKIEINSNAKIEPKRKVYFTGKCEAVTAELQTSTDSVDFGNVEQGVEYPQNITLTNIGGAKMTISSIEFVNDGGGVFSFVETPPTPIEVEPANWYTLGIKFTPAAAEVEYNGSVKVTSDASNLHELLIKLRGKGVPPTGVAESEVTTGNGLLKLKAMPNPFDDRTILQYNLYGSLSRNVDIYLVDIFGRKAFDIVNSNLQPGDYSAELSSSRLASGTYYVIAQVEGSVARLPIIIIK